MQTSNPLEEDGAAVLADFSQAHSEIISHLMAFSGLPTGLQDAAAHASARKVAADALVFFQETIFAHHVEEEQLLFPEVLARASRGVEHERIGSVIEQLTAEHRQIEALWSGLAPALRRIVAGESLDLDADAVHSLVLDYGAHAAFEEADFLPLSREILRRNAADLPEFASTLNGQLDRIHAL